MVCSASGQPCGEPIATLDEAKTEARKYAGGTNGYHARPVEVTITVLGDAPEPWFAVIGRDGIARRV